MKKAIVLGGMILALTAGSAYAMDHGTHHSEMTANQSQSAKAAAAGAGGGYDKYGRPTGYVPGKVNFQPANKTFTIHEMMDRHDG